MDLSNFQRKAVILIFASILVGSVLLAKKEPLKKGEEKVVAERTPISSKTGITNASVAPVKININTADESEIIQLPGIGPSLADGIIKNRPYSTMNDLLNVPGIGEKRLSRIKEMIDLPDQSAETQSPAKSHGRGPAPTVEAKTDLNTATIERLSTIPGIGAKTAQAVVDYRTKNGKFSKVEDLLFVHGIGPRICGKLKEYVYVQSAAGTGAMAPNRQKTYDSRVDQNVKCPFCGMKLWEKGARKMEYIRCPYCLKILSDS